jgi:hypothetical protein
MLPIEERKTRLRMPEGLPIWMAALVARGCQAVRDGGEREVVWRLVGGRAQYTNGGTECEVIQPFGIAVQGGETMAVSWRPGDTGYTVERSGSVAA